MRLSDFSFDVFSNLINLNFEWNFSRHSYLKIPLMGVIITPEDFKNCAIMVNGSNYTPSFLEKVLIWEGIRRAKYKYEKFRDINRSALWK